MEYYNHRGHLDGPPNKKEGIPDHMKRKYTRIEPIPSQMTKTPSTIPSLRKPQFYPLLLAGGGANTA
ncbi:hypothetical protein B0T18DRAFT_413021 [Schizothecium vesticola]|uniref:Uncharacterized protein n=1 Tax=Schizothecium vesticola TaxID=314040 RepID=A0AA40EWX1_9PEZI|nr:hypothetical protein B0T18DRAFT_413021 [Schizothecium vesticola]